MTNKKKLKNLHERERKALIAVTSEANIESQRLFEELNGPTHLALGSPGIDGPKGITICTISTLQNAQGEQK